MNLISTTDFVLGQKNKYRDQEYSELVYEYAKFLKQPLEIWMFVPMNQAKEKCFFEGFELVLQNDFFYTIYRRADGCSILLEKLGDRTIESLIQYELKLTLTAIKQIGL